MRALLPGLVWALACAAPRAVLAGCGEDPGDLAAVASARAQVDADCDCAAAPSHRAYVRCALGVARQRIGAGSLPRRCKGDVKACAARSTCGRPELVTCCIPVEGAFECKVVRDAGACAQKGGTVGGATSCCDACARCGGIAGVPCPPGSFCELPAGHCCCDFQGTCVEIPSPCLCARVFDPVCGCDGATYGNDCERRCAGVSKAHDGPCRAP